ncbi:hypothetical protein D9M68_569940 [compost metagenome]
MVTPPALIAAIPVGATITVRLWVKAIRFLRNVVFPVPAFPVKKICREVKLIKRAASTAGSAGASSFIIHTLRCSPAQYTAFKINRQTPPSTVTKVFYRYQMLKIVNYTFSLEFSFYI